MSEFGKRLARGLKKIGKASGNAVKKYVEKQKKEIQFERDTYNKAFMKESKEQIKLKAKRDAEKRFNKKEVGIFG